MSATSGTRSAEMAMRLEHTTLAESDRQRRNSAAVRNADFLLGYHAALVERGIQDALRLLNARVRFRFTGVHVLDAPKLRTLFLFDREYPHVLSSGGSRPLEDSYADIVVDWREVFFTENSLQDARLERHPARATVRSYLGAPLRFASGRVWGVLAHHDNRQRIVPPGEADLLTEIGGMTAFWLRDHGGAPSEIPLTV